MPVSRRQTITAAGGLAMSSGTVFARGEHDDDERDDTYDDEDEAPGEHEPAAPMTALRVAHFSPDAPNVDVYVDGERVIADLAYDSITPYLEITPGTYTVTITAAGDADTVAFEGDLWLGRAFYTVAAIGELGAGTFRPHVLIDDGSVLLRAVHAAPDAPAVDIYANDGDNPIIEDVAFGQSTNYVAIPAASYTLDIRPAGDPDTTVASFDVDLDRGVAYTGFAIGYLEPGDREDRAFTLRATVDGPMATHQAD
ncbi:DUF4397 domain-containing protein [Natronosalvus amylolyticus]|uniref:DUF4397 domain-containing protein n=1 Tax=Natronosalvus amylolyticus TaxID=2961994 RepID=UPI003CCCC800